MKNIIEELLKKFNIWDASARISHFIVHSENQIDLWYIRHDFKKDDSYNEMCRDVGYMISAIGTDLLGYLKDHTASDSMIRLFYRLILLCEKNTREIITEKLGSDNCIKYGINPVWNEDAPRFIDIPKNNEDSLREKIIEVLNDASYGTSNDTLDAFEVEVHQSKFIHALIKKYAK